ncbi:MAG: hypothetical protein FWD73_08530 [Polyangiaceae bacterium]|nr:hypothetical protein [Polyangiaceae bacterium]
MRARAGWIGLVVLGVVSVLVFWIFEALPFKDLPAHAGFIAMRHRYAESAFEQRFYVFAPHLGPYSLFQFLGEGFGRVVGPLGAVRALATLPIIATPLALLFARRRLYQDRSPVFGFIGLMLSFNVMTALGFASYLLGVAVMLVGLTLWLELLVATDNRAPNLRRRELVMAAYAPFIFVAHGHAFVLFLVCAGVACVAAGNIRARLLRLWVLAPAIGFVAWVGRGVTTPGSGSRLWLVYVSFFDKLGLLGTSTLMTYSGVDAIISMLVLIFTMVSARLTVPTLFAFSRTGVGAERATDDARHSRALYVSALVLLLAFLALPRTINWFALVDLRIVPLVVILPLLAIQRATLPRPLTRLLDAGAPICAATIVLVAMVASYKFQAEASGFREVLARVPAEARLLNLPLDPKSEIFLSRPFVHYDKLPLIERPIIVSDIWFQPATAIYPTPQNPVLRLPSSYHEDALEKIDWPAYHLDDWDFVLIRTKPSATQPSTPDSLVLDTHKGGWWLFRRVAASYAPSRPL